jgi:hypothetical protein
MGCEACGNDRPITVTRDGRNHEYDSFECAIHALEIVDHA